MRCPACPIAELSSKGRCHTCGGVWLDEDHVRDQAARSLVFTGGTYSERRCPVCDEEMSEPLVFDVPIDRCEAHGMWFDKAELEEVLSRARSESWRHRDIPPPHDDQVDDLIAVMRMWRKR